MSSFIYGDITEVEQQSHQSLEILMACFHSWRTHPVSRTTFVILGEVDFEFN